MQYVHFHSDVCLLLGVLLSGRVDNEAVTLGLPFSWFSARSIPVLVAYPVWVPLCRYNSVHAMTRATVERAFGVLKMRWRCLMQHLRCKTVQRDIKVVA